MKYFFRIGLLFFVGCAQTDSAQRDCDKLFSQINPGQVSVDVKVGKQWFYPSGSIFSGPIQVIGDVLTFTLVSDNESRMIVDLRLPDGKLPGDKSWQIKSGDASEGSVKMGRIKDKQQQLGEGYMMVSGEVRVLKITKNRVDFVLTGQVSPYSAFNTPEHSVDLKGYAVFNKPALIMNDSTGIIENEIE